MSPRQRGQHRSSGAAGSGPFAGVKSWFSGLSRPQRIGVIGGSALVVILVGVVATAAATGSNPKRAAATTSTTAATTTTAVKLRSADPPRCPLTGLVAPGHKVPQRPALGVKVDNDPASRPQSGLDQADIVYEEMAEGGITRYLVVFQCQDAPLIGPIRSVRWDDWNILAQYGHPILSYSGGIQPWMDTAASLTWLFNANGSIYPTANAYYRYSSSSPPANQGAPYDYYSSTGALYGLDQGNKQAPPMIFHYSARPPRGSTPAVSASIPFSSASPVVWQWNTKAHQWLRFYGTQPDNNPLGQQFHTTNVVVQIVPTRPGPYDESGPNSPDVESITTGTGTVYVLRDGKIEKGTWSRPTLSDITRLKFPNGRAITLEPGKTWFEVVPAGTAVHFTP